MKKISSLVITVLLLTSCQKETKIQSNSENVKSEIASVSTNNKPSKLTICHNSANGTWKSIIITENDLPGHLAHGDVVPDADGDGYTKANPCGNGSQNDCDDNNAFISPGATEVCDNGIDDNCNGQIDENCGIPTITICNQVWMLRNLDVDHYRNGDPIPQVTDPTEWSTLTTGAWCYYNNDPATGAIYGKLYNWFAVNDPRGLAPADWHISTDAEWTTLSNCLGGSTVAGGEIKEAGLAHWASPNTDASNSSGFTALPGGWRGLDGTFSSVGQWTYWWTSTSSEILSGYIWDRYVNYFNGFLPRDNFNLPGYGFSVRCVKD